MTIKDTWYKIGKTERGYVAYYQSNDGTYYSHLSPKTQKLTGCKLATARTLEGIAIYGDTYKSYSGAYNHAMRAIEKESVY